MEKMKKMEKMERKVILTSNGIGGFFVEERRRRFSKKNVKNVKMKVTNYNPSMKIFLFFLCGG